MFCYQNYEPAAQIVNLPWTQEKFDTIVLWKLIFRGSSDTAWPFYFTLLCQVCFLLSFKKNTQLIILQLSYAGAGERLLFDFLAPLFYFDFLAPLFYFMKDLIWLNFEACNHFDAWNCKCPACILYNVILVYHSMSAFSLFFLFFFFAAQLGNIDMLRCP